MRRLLAILTLSCLLLPATTTLADDLQDEIKSLQNRLNELEAEVANQKNQQLRREEVKDLIAEAAEDAPAGGAKLPAWLKDLKFKGDLRLRYEGIFPEEGKDRNRGRFRLRFGVYKTLLEDQLLVAFRLASGDSASGTSTNQTFDNSFTKKDIWIDQAYMKFAPKCVKGFAFLAGKMPNPLVHTDLVWDSDLNPEGVAAAYTLDLGAIKPFASIGYFIAEENPATHDITLTSYQAGLDWQLCEDLKWTFAGTYYDYDKLDVNSAEAYRMVNLTNKFSGHICNLPVATYFDWIYNCGDQADVNSPTSRINENHGYAAGVKVGQNKAAGDWSASYKYAHIELNSTPGFFNDSDFGGANRKGHVIGGNYNLAKNVILGGKLLLVEDIIGPASDELDTIVQADLVIKF